MRGSRCTPPPPAISPTRGSGSANSAFSAAMMMSQASAVSNPPPIAQPFTAAISGLSRSKRCVMPAKPFGPLGRRRPAACTFRSLPAENARSPAPVMMPTHRSSRAANSSHTVASSSFASACSAFSTSGRFSVTMRTRPSSCTMQYWCATSASHVMPDLARPSTSFDIHAMRRHGRPRSLRRP